MNVNFNKPAALPGRQKDWAFPEAPPPASPRLGNWRDWVNVALLFLTLGVAVFSIEQADWMSPQPSFTLVLFLAVLVTWLLVISRLPGWAAHIIAQVTGLLVTLWQTLNVLPGEKSIGHLLAVISGWWHGADSLLPDEEKVVFAAVITLIVWLVGYLGAWFVMRKHNAWVSVALGAVVIIVNLSNLSAAFYYYFPAYFTASVLLVIQTRIAGQYSRKQRGSGYKVKSLLYLTTSLVCIIVLASSLAWITPQARATGLQNLIANGLPWKQDVRESRLNFFNAVPAKQAISTSSSVQEVNFETGWNQGRTLYFTVISSRPAYWPVKVFDVYKTNGWTSSPTTGTILGADTPLADAASANFIDVLEYQVTMEISGDVMLAAGDFVSSSSPVTVQRTADNDIMEVTASRILGIGESYSVKSVLVNPIPEQLDLAGLGYPQSVNDSYLQLPPDYSPAVRLLSENVTAGASTPYDKVLAVINYLSALPYEAILEALPPETDGVEHFLFTEKRGFCLYFASAMAVMLRTVDVPTRLVVGYLPGDPGRKSGTFLLRDYHYHAWAQVYFPGYGWVNFEATPGGGGGTAAQVPVEEPLVSASSIRDLEQWNAWIYPGIPAQEETPKPPTPSAAVSADNTPGRFFSFREELGIALIVILLVIIGLAIILGIFMLSRRIFLRRLWHVRRESLADSTYTKLCRLAVMAKIYPLPQQTPREFAANLKAALPDQAEAIDNIIQAYQENRFGNRDGKLGLYEEALLLKSRHAVYDKLLRLAGKRAWGLKLLTPETN